MKPDALLDELLKNDFTFYAGVPCSLVKGLMNQVEKKSTYIAAPNEGDAVSIASGAYLGGKKAAVFMQNSGLSNAVSPLASLCEPFKIPVLLFVTLRGEPGIGDEPQHRLMGKITEDLLTLLEIPYEFLNPDAYTDQIGRASSAIDNEQSYAFIVRRGVIGDAEESASTYRSGGDGERIISNRERDEPSRLDALASIQKTVDDNTALLATTGKTGRELFELEDRPNQLYMVGSMGCISSLGMGLATAMPKQKVVAIDGDGALIMRMGNMSMIGYYRPANLLHILLDNESHDSTGGQQTTSAATDFPSLAAGCGYQRVIEAHTASDLEEYIAEWEEDPKLTFLYLKIRPGSKPDLGRPVLKPYEVKARLMKHLHE